MDLETALAKAAALPPGAEGDRLAEIFLALRRSASAPKAAEVLQRCSEKASVLRFLLAVYERKRIFRRQVAAFCSLLGRYGWAAALASDTELRQRWPSEMQMEVANCGYASTVSEPPGAPPKEDAETEQAGSTASLSDEDEEGSPVATVAPQRSMADTLAMLEDGLKRLAAAKYSFTVLTGSGLDEDDLFAAFETFRRAVCRITQDSRINKAALDKIEHKDSILKFLLDVHSRKKRHRKRTEALLSLLLELESWKEAFADDEDLQAAIAEFRGPEMEEPAEEAEEEEEEEDAEEDPRTLSTLWREDVDEKIDAAAARGAIGLLLVRVVAAHNLINADWFSLSDPYVKVKVGRQKQSTAVVDDCLDPRWDSETWFFDIPAETTLVRFEVWDKDALQDDPLGHVSFPARLAPTAPGQERLRFALDSVEHGELEVEMAFLRCPVKGDKK